MPGKSKKKISFGWELVCRDVSKAKAAGTRAFAMKPLTKKEIARTIRKVLDE
ncbi:MAG: hypothetical protein ABSC19_16360 [Syntrophorhabdales bacterium]|jgi:hypothetical protein